MKAELKEVLKMLEQLNPHDLSVVQERIAPTRKLKRMQDKIKATAPKNDVFSLHFEEYVALSDDERERIQLRAYQLNHSWVDAELDRLGAQWLLVCRGEVIQSSPTLRDYPSREKLVAVGKESGCVPFVFVKEPLIEESVWSSLPGVDFYPTLQIAIGARGCRVEDLSATGLVFMADFDSGSPNLFLDYERMLSGNIIDRQPVDQTHFRPHLGQVYCFHVWPVVVGVTDEQGRIKTQEFPGLCVRNWQQSPLCRVNPNREALAGRNLLLEFPLRLELNGRQRMTTVLSDTV